MAEGYDRLRRLLAEVTDYERETRTAYTRATFDLARMERLCARLGDPQRRCRTAHVAGTKGKGSTSALLAAILGASGRRTGLYTSPHLVHMGERIVVDGRPASPEELGLAFGRIEPMVLSMVAEGERFTFFELLTALAFDRFASEHLDDAVIEVGLGGRLDSTNVVEPAVAAVTSIGLDHTDKLGATLEAIAFEKAGIAKAGVPLVSGVADGPAARVIAEVAARRGAPLLLRGADFESRVLSVDEAGTVFSLRTPWHRFARARIRLVGRHMAENAAIAATMAGSLSVSGEAILAGLESGWIDARFHILPGDPRVVVDGAHNPDAVRRLVEAMGDVYGENQRFVVVVGAMRDKDVAGMVELLAPVTELAIAAPLGSPRELEPEAIRALFASAGVRCETAPSVDAALERARAEARSGGTVLVTGSLYLAGAALRSLGALAEPGASPSSKIPRIPA